MIRLGYFAVGSCSLALGALGVLLPLLPTVPFIILAAFCFARGSPAIEQWLVTHPHFGPHITAWRMNGAISRRGKRAAVVAFAFSALIGLATLSLPWSLLPLAIAPIGAAWILSRPDS